MIRIDALWLATQPTDMRAGADRLLAMWYRFLAAPKPTTAICLPTYEPPASNCWSTMALASGAQHVA